MDNDVSFDIKHGILDCETPQNFKLSAIYKRTFAYHTFRQRSPKMLTELMESLIKYEDEIICRYGKAAHFDVQCVIRSLARIRTSMLNNHKFEKFYDKEPDTQLYNQVIENLPEEKKSWFGAYWLQAECYLYRRINYMFKLTNNLKTYDYFAKQKQIALYKNRKTMIAILEATGNLKCNAENFVHILKLQLWGNRCDLSITQDQPKENLFEEINKLDEYILTDQANEVWQCLVQAECNKPIYVDIVCDNASFELFTDLVMAVYILEQHLAAKVRFYVKAIPWFVSDVIADDFEWILRFFRQDTSVLLRKFDSRITDLMRKNKLVLEPTQYFWTSPYEFYRMREICPCLYVKLADATLIIFKGDLNYRKLIGDYAYKSTESFETCLKSFNPSSVCALRCIKCDLYCGLPKDKVQQLSAESNDWMITGKYAVIHFAKKMF